MSYPTRQCALASVNWIQLRSPVSHAIRISHFSKNRPKQYRQMFRLHIRRQQVSGSRPPPRPGGRRFRERSGTFGYASPRPPHAAQRDQGFGSPGARLAVALGKFSAPDREMQVRRRLAAGGSRIRTIGTAWRDQGFQRAHLDSAGFPANGKVGANENQHHDDAGRLPRDRWVRILFPPAGSPLRT